MQAEPVSLSLWKPPATLLARLRWFFLLFSLFFLVTFQPQVLTPSSRPVALRLLTCACLLGLALFWLSCYRRQRFPVAALPLEAATFVLAVVVPDDPFKALGLLYIAVNFRAFYGSWRQALGFTVTALVTFSGAVIAVAHLGGPDRVPLLVQSVPGVPVLAVIAHLVAVSSERGERATARERVLSRTGVAIALAADEAAVRREALAAVTTLAADQPGVRADLVLPGAAAATGSDGAARLVLPLRTREHELGVLQVDSPSELPMEVRDALEALAAQTAMGLENAALTSDLRFRATHDALTGLGNRGLVDDRLQRALAEPRSGSVALLLLDLDGFKAVNDAAGHAAGDALLVALGRRLRDLVRADDLVARLGGDEFVVLLDRPGAAEEAPQLAERVVRELCAPVSLGGTAGTVRVGVSVGVGLAGPGSSASEVLRAADGAMYAAKQAGKGRTALASSAVG